MEHTARQRSQSLRDAARPSTSSGAPSAHHEKSSRSRRAVRPPPHHPLVNLTPKFQEAPQWSTEGRGRAVRAPPGVALVDLATGPPVAPGGSRFLEVPPRNLIRRDQKGPGLPPSQPPPPPSAAAAAAAHHRGRQRSRSIATAGSSSGFGPHNLPPMPPLPPTRAMSRDATDPGFGAKDARPRDLVPRGRSGTVRH